MTGILAATIGTFLRKLGLTWSVNTGDAIAYSAGAYAPLTAGSYYLFRGGIFDNSQETSTAYYYSSNGSTWTTGTLPTATGISCAAFNGTTLLILSGFGANSDTAWTTTNGTTWTARDTGVSAGKHTSAFWDGTRFLVTWTDAGGGIKHSTDGVTWTQIDPGPGLSQIAFDGTSTYVALRYDAGTNGTNTGYVCSGNPTTVGNWTTSTMPSSLPWSRVVYGNGVFVAFANNTQSYATSTNGTTWTNRTLATNEEFGGSGDGSENRNFPLFFEGLFYYWSGNRNLFSSSDGITWTDLNISNLVDIDELAAWAAGGGKIVGAGMNYVNANEGSQYRLLGE